MSQPIVIKKIAVLGAGVMGAQIAAHCVNAGIETLLFDLASPGGNHNALIEKAISNLVKLKPSPLATPETIKFMQAKNYDDHLADLLDCDLIIEAIAERMDWKESLYQRIVPFINEKAVLVTNTSGLSINSLSHILPESLRARFCGMHFFNPPRYMHLAELIPAQQTSVTLLNQLESWLTRFMGKGVVVANDTPNFIANRIGVFSLLVTLHHAKTMELGFDDVDALTGTLLGRPKSATFRTMDVVGLDTLQHVVNTMDKQLVNDPWHALFTLPDWLTNLIKNGHLGQKTSQGIYRKIGKQIEVYDINSSSYRTAEGKISPALKSIMSNPDSKQKMQALFTSTDKQAKFLAACYRDVFHYCAYHLADIAHTVRDVDLAIRWGFGWAKGPFETWQTAGVNEITAIIEQNIAAGTALTKAKLPTWLTTDLQFYTSSGAFSAQSDKPVPRKSLPVYQRQLITDGLPGDSALNLTILFENEGIRLSHFKDDIALLSFKSKANTISQSVLDGLEEAIEKAEKECQGMIIYQSDANNFSGGADLKAVATLIQANKMDVVEQMLTQFQHHVMRLKYASIPVVAALRGRALGGGCELMMHCHTVAAFESYPGLVEAGVGLIPAGGGCKEMAMRAATQAGSGDLMHYIQRYFEQIATAVVAGSAPDASLRGYLRPKDCWVMHSDEVLYAAVAKINYLQATNYVAPLKSRFKVAGREGHAKLQVGLVNWLEGGFISQHDYFLANKLAEVMCGGDVNQGELVDEAWLLTLEKKAFIELAATPLTQARISILLETGKPLRN